MFSARFPIVFILLIILQHRESSLLSRFKSNTEFVMDPDTDYSEDIDIDDQTYRELVHEVPEVRYILPPRKNVSWFTGPRNKYPYLPYIKRRPRLERAPESDDDELDSTSPKYNLTITSSTRSYVTRWPATQNGILRGNWTHDWKYFYKNLSRRVIPDHIKKYDEENAHHFTGEYMGTCYLCSGGHDIWGIPKSSICHDAWESNDWRKRTLARYFRAKCYRNSVNNTWTWNRPIKYMNPYFERYEDKGLKKEYYGPSIEPGCYKRWLDIGTTHTQRGCRKWHPDGYPGGFASHRYRRLEYSLGKADRDACVFSPHASLTPFHRDISLFARYHVCICKGKYCNDASRNSYSMLNIMIVVFFKFVIEM